MGYGGDYVLVGRPLRPDQVGYKLARLALLAGAGLPVPPFYALPVTCFRTVAAPIRGSIERDLRTIDWSDLVSVSRAAGRIRDMFASAQVPAGMEAEILAAFDGQFAPGSLVAVRASVAGSGRGPGEDSAQDAFAGMSDSFLYVPRSSVLDRIRQCWASAFSAESLLYRHAQGLDLQGFDVAVGVQEMALGERSFVVFTCNPVTGAPDTVVAAGYGIGEGVVQEKVGVDHYVLRSGGTRDGGEPTVVEHRITDKPERLGLDPARPEAGPVVLSVVAELRSESVLTDTEVRVLAEIGQRVQRLFGGPQDIEGTFTADGALWLVQSRPVTVDLDLRRQWSSANVTESFPGVTTALTYTFAQKFYRMIFYDLYRRMGVRPRTLHANGVYLDRMIGLHHGRVYYELAAWYHLHRQLPVFPLFRASWERMMAIPDTGGCAGAAGRSRLAWLRLAWPIARVAHRIAVHDIAMRRFAGWWESVIGPRRGRDVAAKEPLARIQDFHQVWTAASDNWGVTLINDAVLSATASVAGLLVARWVPGGDQALLSDLLCGDEDNHSVAVVVSLVRLAERVRSCPELLVALETRPLREVWQAVEHGRFGAGLRDEALRHLHRYGDRGLAELKMEQPGLRQAPWELLRLAGQYARSDLSGERLRDRERQVRAAAELQLSRAMRGHPVRRLVLRALLARLRGCVRYREDSRYCRSELFGLAKTVFHGLGTDLAERGALKDAGDVVHLTQDELFGYFDGTGVSENLQALADTRRAEFEAPGPEPPMRFTTLGAVRDSRPAFPDAPAPQSEAVTLRGLGSSRGRVRGTARVVLDPHYHVASGEGLILVARETDPGWLFLMLQAAGIVVERGTMLSHTAITGRKLGIPTIVSLPGATTAIPDGALVEMDGASGLVTILDRMPA